MAISVYGITDQIDDKRWSELHNLAATPYVTGLNVTSTGNYDRQVTVATGQAYAAGVLARSTTAVTVTLPTQTASGKARIDAVVLRIDWTGAGSASVTRIVGTAADTAQPPALTRTPGVTFDILLAYVFVFHNFSIVQEWDITNVPQAGFRTMPYARITTSMTTAIPHNSRTQVTFQRTIEETNTTFGNHAANKLFTPKDGLYFVQGSVLFDYTGEHNLQAIVMLDGIDVVRHVGYRGPGVSASGIVRAKAGQNITLETYQNSGGTYYINSGSDLNHLSALWLQE